MKPQDYNMIAYQFTQLRSFSYAQLDSILQGLLCMFKKDNPDFDKKKFLNKINNLKKAGF